MRALLLLLLTLSVAWPAAATVVEVLPLPEMKRRAGVVVRATVVDVRVEREHGDKRATYTTLRVDDVVKGATKGELLTVFQPGAVADGKVRWVVGQPQYRVGDVIAFFGLRHQRNGLDVVVHLSLRAWDVRPSGIVQEHVLDVVDRATGRAPVLREFPTWAKLVEALE